MLAKLPETMGWLRFRRGKRTGKRAKLIEYKAPLTEQAFLHGVKRSKHCLTSLRFGAFGALQP